LQRGTAQAAQPVEDAMCRSIKPLRLPDRQANPEEIAEAALQYVRKVSGYRKPSRANQEAFEAAVEEVAEATRRMLERLNAAPVAAARHHD
jgi:hypothetical protein